jgi:peptide/nickel transport system substrate-binding protein
MRCLRAIGVSTLMVTSAAHGGGRPYVGGSLEVTLPSVGSTEAVADSPSDAVLAALASTPLCRLAVVQKVSDSELKLTPKPGITTLMVTELLANVKTSPSIYGALAKGIERFELAEDAVLVFVADAQAAELEAALCHPAFSRPNVMFVADAVNGARFVVNPEAPTGRPWLDSVTVTTKNSRTSVAEGASVQVTIGHEDTKQALFATYLVWSPKVPEHFGQALRASVTAEELVRYFLKASAAPLEAGLPLWLSGNKRKEVGATTEAPKALDKEVALTLTVDASMPEQRLIAERLQLKLKRFGYRLSIKSLPRPQLRSRWQEGLDDLSLQTVLLPPSSTIARAVVGALQKAPFSKSAWMFPLYARGLVLKPSPTVHRLSLDTQGLPVFENAFVGTAVK